MSSRIIFSISVLTCSYFLLLACTCIGERTCIESYKNADVVFIGEVIADTTIFIDEYYGFETYAHEYTFVNTSSFNRLLKYNRRLASNDTIKVRTGMGHGDCGEIFEIGTEYLVYAKYDYSVYTRDKENPKHILGTDICMGNTTEIPESIQILSKESRKVKRNLFKGIRINV